MQKTRIIKGETFLKKRSTRHEIGFNEYIAKKSPIIKGETFLKKIFYYIEKSVTF